MSWFACHLLVTMLSCSYMDSELESLYSKQRVIYFAVTSKNNKTFSFIDAIQFVRAGSDFYCVGSLSTSPELIFYFLR